MYTAVGRDEAGQGLHVLRWEEEVLHRYTGVDLHGGHFEAIWWAYRYVHRSLHFCICLTPHIAALEELDGAPAKGMS